MCDAAEELGKVLQWLCSPRGGNNFYARVMNGCGRHAHPGLNTCGVRIDREGRYLMEWDPAWFKKQTKPFQVLVIIHEAAHLILRHVERGIVIERQIVDNLIAQKIHEVLNIAMDMAVNDIAIRPMLTDTSMNFAECADLLIWPEDRKYPRGLSAEEYFARLLKDLKDHGWSPDHQDSKIPQQQQQPGEGEGEEGEGEGQPQQGQGQGEEGEGEPQQGQGQGQGQGEKEGGGGKVPGWFQNLLNRKHRTVDWSKICEDMTDGEVQRALDRAKRDARKIARQAARQTKKSRGVIPGNIKEIMEELLAIPVIPWQEVLRGQLRSAVSQKLDESTAYPSVALLNDDEYEPYPGFQNNFTFNILAAFDTSGSMSSDDFIDCCRELRGLLEKEEGVTVMLLHFDWGIQYEEELTSDDAEKLQRSVARYGCGGTSFEGPLRYAARVDTDKDWTIEKDPEIRRGAAFDLMLMFTDGYAPIPLPDLDPKIPLFWVLTEDGKEDQKMKHVLRMES